MKRKASPKSESSEEASQDRTGAAVEEAPGDEPPSPWIRVWKVWSQEWINFGGPRRVVEIKDGLHPDVAAIDIYFYGYYGDLRPGMHPLSGAHVVPPGEWLQAHLVRGAVVMSAPPSATLPQRPERVHRNIHKSRDARDALAQKIPG